jgi:hypothetical protein
VTRQRQVLIGLALMLFGAATIVGEVCIESRVERIQYERQMAMADELARLHPGEGRGVDLMSSDAALIPEFLGALFVIAGVVVVSGKLGRKKAVTS